LNFPLNSDIETGPSTQHGLDFKFQSRPTTPEPQYTFNGNTNSKCPGGSNPSSPDANQYELQQEASGQEVEDDDSDKDQQDDEPTESEQTVSGVIKAAPDLSQVKQQEDVTVSVLKADSASSVGKTTKLKGSTRGKEKITTRTKKNSKSNQDESEDQLSHVNSKPGQKVAEEKITKKRAPRRKNTKKKNDTNTTEPIGVKTKEEAKSRKRKTSSKVILPVSDVHSKSTGNTVPPVSDSGSASPKKKKKLPDQSSNSDVIIAVMKTSSVVSTKCVVEPQVNPNHATELSERRCDDVFTAMSRIVTVTPKKKKSMMSALNPVLLQIVLTFHVKECKLEMFTNVAPVLGIEAACCSVNCLPQAIGSIPLDTTKRLEWCQQLGIQHVEYTMKLTQTERNQLCASESSLIMLLSRVLVKIDPELKWKTHPLAKFFTWF
jgi:hypothetical protein